MQAYVAEPAHADLGQCESGLDPAIGLHAGIDYPCSARESEGLHPKEVRLIRHAVGDFARGLVHPE